MTGAGAHRVVDHDDRQRADHVPGGAHGLHFRDFFFERAAGQGHALHGFLELARLAVDEPARAGVLALLVAPDAVVGVVEAMYPVAAVVRQAEAVALAPAVMRQDMRRDAVPQVGLGRHEPLRIDLARLLEQHTAAMRCAALGRVQGPGGISQRLVERGMVCISVRLPAHDVGRERGLGQGLAETCLEFCPEIGGVEL